jgi:beta-N-acetylhexosaminidase
MKRFVALIMVCMLSVFLFASCKKKGNTAVDENAMFKEQKEKINKIVEDNSTEKAVEEILGKMSLEEKVWQMMFVTPEDITGVSVAVKAGEATKKALQTYPVGGIIYFGQNFENPDQTAQMIKNTQEYSKIPLFISVDEEGGTVSRLGSKRQMGTKKQPPMLEIGETKDGEKAYSVGTELANDLGKFGFNVDFAPVADVLVSRDNVETQTRSFGYDAENVAFMVENVVKGLQDNGISATLKHFPGAGATTVDTHTGYSANPRTLDELRKTEFLPFASGIQAGVDFVMVSHMTLTNATKEKLPCSLSEEVIRDMLIDELGFKGIVITDSLRMGAITEHYSPSEIGVMAVKAGNDMILMPKNMEATHKAIVEAVNNGEITEERINESVRKILKLKIEKGMWN